MNGTRVPFTRKTSEYLNAKHSFSQLMALYFKIEMFILLDFTFPTIVLQSLSCQREATTETFWFA